MVTRAKAGISKPIGCLTLHVTTISPIPKSNVHALRDLKWQKAMIEEYNALITNEMWVLVPRLANVNVVHFMWLFKSKFHADGSLSSRLSSWIRIILIMFAISRDLCTGLSKPHRVISSQHGEFAMTDLGSLNYFLGISVSQSSTGLFLSHATYAEELFERANMLNCNPCRTPVDIESKLGHEFNISHFHLNLH
ncbi:ribonuclease H-like domain-containing protein [Tanacetum coccineum]